MARIHSITWSCPRCGKPFLTEQQMQIHYLSCGKSFFQEDALAVCEFLGLE